MKIVLKPREKKYIIPPELLGDDVDRSVEYYIVIRPFDKKVRDQRREMINRMRMKMARGETAEAEVTIWTAELQEFEWRNAIVDFCLPSDEGPVYFNKENPEESYKMLQYVDEALEQFINQCIDDANGISPELAERLSTFFERS